MWSARSHLAWTFALFGALGSVAPGVAQERRRLPGAPPVRLDEVQRLRALVYAAITERRAGT